MSVRGASRFVGVTAAGGLLLAGCGLFGGSKADAGSVSVFSVKPGECFTAPKKVEAELSTLTRVECTAPHTQEAYASIAVDDKIGAKTAGYPGNEVLTNFAQGACAQQFTSYVGIDYRDSSLFFTYLLPSARSWEQGKDRRVTCFVTTAGAPLTATVRDAKR